LPTTGQTKRDSIPLCLTEARPATYLGQQIAEHKATKQQFNNKTKQKSNELPQQRRGESRHRGQPPTPPRTARAKGGEDNNNYNPKIAMNGRGTGGERQQGIQPRELWKWTYNQSGNKPPCWGASARDAGWGQGNTGGQSRRRPTPTKGARGDPRQNKQ
jgi:hypothetical protein